MQHIDLSGLWQVYLDADKTPALPACYPDQIILPGTTSAAGLGPENPARETYFLTDAHAFEGYAWFMRRFEAGDWADQQVMLTLERTRKTTLYLDGAEIGAQSSLCTPHRYLLPPMAAGWHTLVIRVDNTDYPTRGGHMTSPDTQSNWNGITGEISLTVARAILHGIRVNADLARGTVRIRADVTGTHSGFASVALPGQMEQLLPITADKLDGVLPLTGREALWDEFAPNLHTLAIDVEGEVYTVSFGLRQFACQGRRLLCNGREVFLRGKHDALVFPLTGYAPTDVDSWMRVLQTARDYGVNHYRFHTCCPPEAAFTAADALGIALSPELPFWGTVAAEGEEGYNAAERAFLIEEGYRMLREYGHHPSFVFLSMGNELWGSKAALNAMLRDYRAYDPDKLYVSGANNFQWVPEVLPEEDVFVGVRFSRERLIRGSYAMCDAPQGIVQVSEPESISTYDRMIVPTAIDSAAGTDGKVLIQYGTGVKEVDAQGVEAFIPQVPVISHEVGQYEFYPDFSEIDRYTGALKARNFEVFRERLQQAGLYGEHEKFFRCAGMLSIACYRREIETLLRTAELSGFQLLDLQDFPGQGTALVGILNAFMASKGLIEPAVWRQFCASTVVLGRFRRFVLADGDDLRFCVQVSECDPRRVHTAVHCALLSEDGLLAEATAAVHPTGHRLSEPVEISLGEVHAPAATRLTVRLTLEDGTVNEYPLWVFPRYEIDITQKGMVMGGKRVAFVSTPAEARALDVPAIVIPDRAGKLPAEYASDFWCYPMFRSISQSMGKPLPVGTLGLCIDAQHPWVRRFTREEYTTPAWYHLLKVAHCEAVPCAAPVVQMIDNTERCQRLCLLWAEDGIPHMTLRLWEDASDVSVRAFAAELMQALLS
ncbi:MAG: hypothetical protein PUC00_01470 [Clostridiales bacterium]|nr:hypothetical protein [Clostridiales bacterium]